MGGCGKDEPRQPPSVKVVSVRQRSLPTVLRLSGVVKPVRSLDLAFGVGGRIKHVRMVGGPEDQRPIGLGDGLGKGLIVAMLDEAPYQRARDIAAASLRAAQHRLASTEAAAALAGLRLPATAPASLPATLPATHPISLSADRAQADVLAARQEVLACELRLKQAEDELAATVLGCPVDDATVLERFVERDQWVQAGAPVVRVADLSTVRVDVHVPGTIVGGPEFSKLKGSALRLVADAWPGRAVEGRVTGMVAGDDGAWIAQVLVTNEGFDDGPVRSRLMPSMRMTGMIGSEKRAMTVPLSAVSSTSDGDVVWRVTQQGAKATVKASRVALGGVWGDQVEVLDGRSELKLADRIVVAPTAGLRDGDEVVVKDTGGEEDVPTTQSGPATTQAGPATAATTQGGQP
jgi:RND family efflux transporter MFP subunit